jgi:hypothetical protein
VKLITPLGIALFAALAPAEASACSCIKRSIAEQLSISRDVLSVRVIAAIPETVKSQGPQGSTVAVQHVTLKIEKVWKGGMGVGNSITTTNVLDTGMCGFLVEPKERLLVYSTDAGEINIDLCSVVPGVRLQAHENELNALSKGAGGRPNTTLERTRER